MNLQRASLRASKVPGPRSAARLYNDIEYELALGEPEERLERAGEQALALLQDRFPGVRDAARKIEDPPCLSRRAGEALHGISRATQRAQPHPLERPGTASATRPSRLLYAHARAHPVLAVAMVAVAIVVIVHYLTYIALGTIALTAIKARGARTSRRRNGGHGQH
jgi:hypothetical protein